MLSREELVLRRQTLRFLRSIIVLAGILLASCYFMPAIDCDGDVVVNPSGELRKFIRRDTKHYDVTTIPERADRWAGHLIVYAAPYAFGLVAAATAWARLVGNRRAERATALLAIGCVATAAVGVIYCAAVEYELWPREMKYGTRGAGLGPGLVWPIVVLLYCLRSLRAPAAGAMCLTLLVSSLLCAWWQHCSDEYEFPAYGLGWSAFATIALASATAFELSVAMERHPALALLRYFVLSPSVLNRDDGTCPTCAHCLFGVTEPRCAECGSAFTPYEVGMTLAELQEAAERSLPQEVVRRAAAQIETGHVLAAIAVAPGEGLRGDCTKRPREIDEICASIWRSLFTLPERKL